MAELTIEEARKIYTSFDEMKSLMLTKFSKSELEEHEVTQEEFDNWYENIKAMSLYDTGVTAEYGDEFITLSCCSYQVEDGRFVVVGKRIK